jgi:asparagine synthase (glutamine-hydrolysing)
MCGIAGSVRWDGIDEQANVANMTAMLAHRGPDAYGLIRSGEAVLGHRRLAVIDTAHNADQPMTEPSSDAWIVFNGEIYNFLELRRELESKGVKFQTRSDTEVLLKGFIYHGESWIKRLVGMFAFAIWEPKNHKLTLVRDRLGKKPLYYAADDEGIIFASELSALRLHPKVSDKINPIALGNYLSLGYTLTDNCIIDGVNKLPPSSVLSLQRNEAIKIRPYWNLATHFNNKSEYRSKNEAEEKLGALLDDSVKSRLIADVPHGTFLSGGIDSAAIAEAMLRIEPPDQVSAFTLGFGERSYSEAAQAKETATALGIHHSTRSVSEDALQDLEKIVQYTDEPFADTSMIPLFYLSEFTRRNVTVALSGDGSDEIFAGYSTYTADVLHQATRWVPTTMINIAKALVNSFMPVNFDKVSLDYKMRRFLKGHNLDFQHAHCFWRGIFDLEELKKLVRPEHQAVYSLSPFDHLEQHFSEVSECHYLDQAMYVDIKSWLVDDILFKVDRMSMAHSLEVRTPFLDHRLVEFAASLPPEWKLSRLQGKKILRRYLSSRLPATILNRKKSGFNAPVSYWFNGAFAESARMITLSQPMLEWFDPVAIEALWTEHHSRQRDNGLRLFVLLCLGLWLAYRPAIKEPAIHSPRIMTAN